MEAIILAGGLGSRLKAVVPEVPKPMAPINGRPFLEYLLDYWANQGVNRFILSVGYKREIIVAYFGEHYKGAQMSYAVEDQPRGTGGGLLLALERLHQPDPFLVINGDTFFEVDLASMRRYHEEKQAEVTIALRDVESNNRYARVVVNDAGRITSFDSRACTSGRTLINGGVYLAQRSAFGGIASTSSDPVSIEDQLYPSMLAASRRLFGYRSRGKFIDIGIPEDYQRAASVLPGA